MNTNMTESEAKVILESEYKFHGECSVFGEALTIAIKALEENEQYKVLGTVEELRIAKENKIPKKPFYTFSEDEEILASCEICDSNIDWTYQGHWRKGKPNYCKNCGQAIDWS